MKIIPPKKYKTFLSQYETTTGFPTQFEIQITNIGKNTFPGGAFVEKQLFVETSIGFRDVGIRGAVTPAKVESLEPKEFHKVSGTWTARIPGPSRIVINIKAKDGGKIDFYQFAKGLPSKDVWYNVFNVVDRHQLDLALLLKELLKKR